MTEGSIKQTGSRSQMAHSGSRGSLTVLGFQSQCLQSACGLLGKAELRQVLSCTLLPPHLIPAPPLSTFYETGVEDGEKIDTQATWV